MSEHRLCARGCGLYILGDRSLCTACEVLELKEQIAALTSRVVALEALTARDTVPAPCGDSHSGAIVVPRGSSSPPASVCEYCRMFACVCAHNNPGVTRFELEVIGLPFTEEKTE